MLILDGKKSREHYIEVLKEKIAKLSFVPCLAIIQIGNRPDSDSFIKSKKSFAKQIGVNEVHVQLNKDITQNEVLNVIKKYNDDKEIQGIIVQLPIPGHLDTEVIINTIEKSKDVDGLTVNTAFMPATARGIKELLSFYNISLSDKKVTVVGQSKLVGKPIAVMCRKEGAVVTVCDSKTEDLQSKTRDADVLLVAIGKPNFIGRDCVSEGQIVIDIGITRHNNDRLVGDVNFEEVKDIIGMITPVPGGVGQMTVLALFENLIDSCYYGGL